MITKCVLNWCIELMYWIIYLLQLCFFLYSLVLSQRSSRKNVHFGTTELRNSSTNKDMSRDSLIDIEIHAKCECKLPIHIDHMLNNDFCDHHQQIKWFHSISAKRQYFLFFRRSGHKKMCYWILWIFFIWYEDCFILLFFNIYSGTFRRIGRSR